MKAIIFDMDGVIVDSEPHHQRALLAVLREIGYGDKHDCCLADYVGRSDLAFWGDFLAKHKLSQTVEELSALKRQRMLEIIRRERPLFIGVVGLLERASARYRLALASGSERPVVEEVLRLDGLGRFFSVVVTDSDIVRGKPAPDIFLHAAQRLGVEPADCWVVEDSKPGITAALAAGMPVIAISNTHPPAELWQATHVVHSYEEIEALLLSG